LPSTTKNLRWSLTKLGLSDAAVNAAWPSWWSETATSSASANAELRFSLARKLGLDPKLLLEDQPKFIWRDKAKFKNLSNEDESIRAALASFGGSIGSALVQATPITWPSADFGALTLRGAILANRPYVGLLDLLGLCWAVGIPVIHLRIFPLSAKHMCAMVARAGDRFAVLLAKDAVYPAPVAYYLAHELGHIALGHLKDVGSLVDLQDPLDTGPDVDQEERAADKFALELLTGKPDLSILTETRNFTAAQLAKTLLEASTSLRIEPGTLALCFGHSTKQWAKANAAMKTIYTSSHAVWEVVNRVALGQLDWAAIPDDMASYARAVMGGLK
jgi:hypothetical protein